MESSDNLNLDIFFEEEQVESIDKSDKNQQYPQQKHLDNQHNYSNSNGQHNNQYPQKDNIKDNQIHQFPPIDHNHLEIPSTRRTNQNFNQPSSQMILSHNHYPHPQQVMIHSPECQFHQKIQMIQQNNNQYFLPPQHVFQPFIRGPPREYLMTPNGPYISTGRRILYTPDGRIISDRTIIESTRNHFVKQIGQFQIKVIRSKNRKFTLFPDY